MAPYSLYLHVPFCIHRCAYCDFNTYAGLLHLAPDYVHALCNEIEWAAQAVGERLPVHTVFFGGGTPSLMPVELVELILATIHTLYTLEAPAEITLEANPGTVSAEHLEGLRQLGVNRLSLGMQSANPGELRMLERQHDYTDVAQAVRWARQAGFENLSLDLIFGLPGQSMESWQHSLELAVDLAPEHLSLYALTLEHGTPMQHWVARGLMEEPDADLAADQYEWSAEYLEKAGFQQYEISNWARRLADGSLWTCRHNLQYWRSQPYLGFGAGAHGFAHGVRVANVLGPSAYIQSLANRSREVPDGKFPASPACASAHRAQGREAMGEFMMMGLRLTQEGVSRADFRERFGLALEEAFGQEIQKLFGLDLLEWEADALRLTQRGRLLGNQVFIEFLD